jgi:hypothetical protein
MRTWTKSRRRLGALAVAILALGAIMIGLAPTALAIHDLDFQLEGNTADDATAVQPYDWESFLDASGPGGTIGLKTGSLPSGFTAVGFASSGTPSVPGDFHLPDETTFSTGSKDTLPITGGWQCGKSNNVGDKVDILNAYSAVYQSGLETILYFGVEKSSPNGDSNIAVWFLQDPDVGCDATGSQNVDFTGDHQNGDVLLVSAFTNGGTQANVDAYVWEGVTETSQGSLNPTPVGSGHLCPAPDVADTEDSCAITNSAPISPPWKHPDKDATRNPALNPLEFFEGGINLTDAGILDACFARFLANTRSSQSLTATIFDYATGSLETCAPSTDLNITAPTSSQTIHAGETVNVTITEKNDGINPLTSPSVTVSPNDCTVTKVSDDGNGDAVLDVDETFTYSCALTPSATTTYTFTGHGLDPRGKDVTWDETDCAGKDEGDLSISGTRVCDPDEVATLTVTVIAPSTDLTATVVATFTFYEKNDGDVALANPTVTASGCDSAPAQKLKASPSTKNVGDSDDDGVFDPTETWVWTCTVTLNSPGTTNVLGKGAGTDNATTPKNITFCADPTTPPAGTICDQHEDAGGSVTLDPNSGANYTAP